MNSDFSEQYSALRRIFPEAPAQFEQIVNKVYSSTLFEGAVSIDCGAHVGKHTLPMARCVGANETVYAFEPISEKISQLNLGAATLRQDTTRFKTEVVAFLYKPIGNSSESCTLLNISEIYNRIQ